MPLDEATHGPWCSTRVWPTSCPGCGDPVFFFSCNHGSKVFFDALGRPWPIHDCDTSWTRSLKRTTDETGRITVHLGPGVSVTRPPDTFSIAPEIIERARRKSSHDAPIPIVKVGPDVDIDAPILGVLREIRRNVNPCEFHGIPDTTFGAAALGPLARCPAGRITVHAPSGNGSGQQSSYSMWIPDELIGDSRIRTGISVQISLQVVTFLDGRTVWFCDEFEVVG